MILQAIVTLVAGWINRYQQYVRSCMATVRLIHRDAKRMAHIHDLAGRPSWMWVVMYIQC
jgi:hypothetical protein